MMKIRTSTQDEKVSNEYESVLKIDDLLNWGKEKEKESEIYVEETYTETRREELVISVLW